MIDWAAHIRRAGLPVGRPAGRTDRAAVAGADRRHPRHHPGLRQHGQRRTTSTRPILRPSVGGWSSSTSTWPARCPDQPGALGDPVPRRVRQPRLGDLATRRRCPAIRFTTGPDVANAAGRVRRPDPPGRGPLRQRRRRRRPGGHRVDLHGRASPPGRPRHGAHALLRCRRSLERQPPEPLDGHATFTLDPSARPADQPAAGAATPGRPTRTGTGRRCRRPTASPSRPRPFTTATTIAGPATLDLWVQVAGTPVDDFQATVTEVRPVGRARRSTSPRGSCAARTRSTHRTPPSCSPTRPTWPTDTGNCRPTSYSLVRIPIDPIVHTFRPGHRAAGRHLGTRRRPPDLGVRHRRQRAAGHRRPRRRPPPRPWWSTWSAAWRRPPALPACNSLRGEPCRTYRAEGNQTG